MRIAHRLPIPFALLALVGVLAYGSSPQTSAGAKPKPSASTAPPAGWKTVMNDSKTCKLSLPPAWVQPDSDGMFGRMEKGEMAMFIEDEETQKAGNWDPVHQMIDKKKSRGGKVEILEESPERIIFQTPHGSLLAVMSFRRSPKTLCVAQIAVPAGEPDSQEIARQIAESLAPTP
jgi:hypothetical protein